MGKKKRIKSQKENRIINQTITMKKPNPMDPDLMAAFSRGRDLGYKNGHQEGLQEGIAKILVFFNDCLQEIDKNVKGIGPKKKLDIEQYFADCLKEAVNNNEIENAKIL